jgi:hypothetical protein
MEYRYRIRTLTLSGHRLMVEFPLTTEGLNRAKKFRRESPIWKRRQIRVIAQPQPNEIICGLIYRLCSKEEK